METQEKWVAKPTAGHKTHGQSVVYNAADGKDIAIVYDGDAYAALIAAAPDLLEVCLGIRKYQTLLTKSYRLMDEDMKRLDAAIAKATGAE